LTIIFQLPTHPALPPATVVVSAPLDRGETTPTLNRFSPLYFLLSTYLNTAIATEINEIIKAKIDKYF